jgi:hypothetical protein
LCTPCETNTVHAFLAWQVRMERDLRKEMEAELAALREEREVLHSQIESAVQVTTLPPTTTHPPHPPLVIA